MRGTSEYQFLELRMQAHDAMNTLLERSQKKIAQGTPRQPRFQKDDAGLHKPDTIFLVYRQVMF